MASNSTLHSGVLHKCGGKVKSWTRRWMVLRSDLSLSYYKDAAKPPLGVISLKDPSIAVRVGQRADCNWPKNSRLERSLVLTTTKRRFYLFAESLEEAQEWLSHLQAAVAQAIGQPPSSSHTVPARLGQPIPGNQLPEGDNFRPASARYPDDNSPMDIRKAAASELALPESVPNRFVPKHYRPKVKRQVTRRHNDDSDFSGVETCSDDDDELDPAMFATGELDPNEFDQDHPIVESFEHSFVLTKPDGKTYPPVMPESLYDVARMPEETVAPSHSNSNNNNGGWEPQLQYEPMDRAQTLKPAVTNSSTNIHESLYDLVRKINAGEVADASAQCEGHSRTQSLIVSSANVQNSSSSSGHSIASQPLPQPDVYEPIQEQVGVSASRSVVNQPLPPVPQFPMAQSVPAHLLSSPSLAVYEPVGNALPTVVNFYEEVEKGGGRVQEALSSDDESFHHRPSSGVGPTLPPKDATLSPHDDEVPSSPPPAIPPRNDDSLQTEYGNAPPLPTKEAMISVVKPPMRAPLREVSGGRLEPGVFQPAIYDEVAAESSRLHNGHVAEDVYDDATSLPASGASQTSSGDQEEVYDDATSVATSSDHRSPPKPFPRSREALPSVQDSLPSDLTGQRADNYRQSTNSKNEYEEGTAKGSPGKVKPCPLPRKKRTGSQGSWSSEIAGRDSLMSDSSASPVKTSSDSWDIPVSPTDTGKGMALFRRRGQEMIEVERRDEPKNRVMSMLLTGGEGQDVSMSAIAETLREIEQEKQMASEERFRFERERKRLEEEKREMEMEKERLREELERTRALLNASK